MVKKKKTLEMLDFVGFVIIGWIGGQITISPWLPSNLHSPTFMLKPLLFILRQDLTCKLHP